MFSTLNKNSLQTSCTSATGSSLESPAHIGMWAEKQSSPPLKRDKTRRKTQSELRKMKLPSSTDDQLQLQQTPDIISFLHEVKVN